MPCVLVTLGMTFDKPEDQNIDGRDADEGRGTGDHASDHGEDIRHEASNRTTGDVLRGRDYIVDLPIRTGR